MYRKAAPRRKTTAAWTSSPSSGRDPGVQQCVQHRLGLIGVGGKAFEQFVRRLHPGARLAGAALGFNQVARALFGDFQMKLKGHDMPLPQKTLVLTASGAREEHGLLGQGKGITVPVQNRQLFWKNAPRHRIRRPLVSLDGKPADLGLRIFGDITAEDFRQELRAKANAQNSSLGLQKFAQKIFFLLQDLVGGGVVLPVLYFLETEPEGAVDVGGDWLQVGGRFYIVVDFL